MCNGKNGVKQPMEKYENDNFIEDQNMDGVDSEYDAAYGSDYDAEGEATYGSDYDPEDDSAFVSENTDEAGYADETEYEPGDAGLEDAESEEEETEPYYDREAFKWLRAENRAKFVKLLSILILSSAILIFASIAWFTMNTGTGTNGMSIRSQSNLFELRTTGSVGLYDDYIVDVDDEYTGDSETGASGKIKWRLTKGNTDDTLTQGNMNNLYLESGTPSSEEMKEIKKLDSSKYGLSPGDYGTLSFIIVPKADSVDTTVKVAVTCYKTEYYLTGDDIGYQKDVFEPMDEEDTDEAEAIKFTKSHIMYFYKDSSDHLHMITETGFDELSITENRNVTLYWVWPEKLKNILELDIPGLDTTGATELRAYLLKNPELFLAKNSEDSSSVFDGIKLDADATESEVQAKANAILATNTSYNPWGARYNNADQIIGDYVGYIMVEGIVNAKGQD